MKTKERLYLRSAFHHFDTLQSTYVSELIHNGSTFSRFVVDSKLFHKIVGLILTLDGDEDGQAEDELNEIFQDENIEFLK